MTFPHVQLSESALTNNVVQAHGHLAWFSVGAKRSGEKWEYGARDPIRDAMPEPPPRL